MFSIKEMSVIFILLMFPVYMLVNCKHFFHVFAYLFTCTCVNVTNNNNFMNCHNIISHCYVFVLVSFLSIISIYYCMA